MAIPDAEKYTVELDSDPDFAAPIAYETSRTEFAAPTMGSRSWARVRGHVHGREGRWGEPLQLDEAPPSVERGPRRPTFRRVQVDEGRGLVHLEWDGVPGRNSYVLRLEPFHGSQPPRQLAVLGHHATLPLEPASYRISVRADRGRNADDSSGDDWSDHIDVRIR